jgi:glucokinase
MKSVLGVDVGGTKIAVAPVDRAGTRLAHPIVAPSRAEDVDSFLEGLEEVLRRALAAFGDFSPAAIGIACAGTVDSGAGEVVSSPNLPLVRVPLGPILQERLQARVLLENDANAAVLGEAIAGAAIGARDVVMLTLGTGIGGGLFLDGKLYRGANGGAGELGHMVVQKGGLPCKCGGHGCLEVYASGSALVRHATVRAGDPAWDPDGALQALREGGGLTGGAVTRLAREGHPGALDAVRELGEWLGVGLISLVNAFDPRMIVVGGGVSDLGELLLRPAREWVRTTAMSPGREKVEIVRAKLGNEAGLVGAALAVWQDL